MAIFKSRYADLVLPDKTITERVFEGINPDATVLIDGMTGRAIKGADYVDQVKSLAGGLAARGFGPGKVIALMAPNMPEYCTVFHAATWAGLTITTINPTYTAPEVAHQLKDAGADILVTIGMFVETAQAALPGTNVTEIVVIGDAPDGTTPLDALMGPPLASQVPVDLDHHNAALPYSSGTTGLPKGVMLSHRNLVVNVDQILATNGIKPEPTAVAFLPFFHIYGLTALMNAHLAHGGTLVTMPRFDLEQFLRLCQDHKTDTLWVVPPVVVGLAKHPMVDQFDLSCVERVFSGAAPLGADVTLAVEARLKTQSVQGYGMTELSPVSHSTPREKNKPGASGVALPNTEVRIVDPETGQDLAAGEDGELWVRGPQVMRGYLNRPDATAETIVEGGWLRTGDIAHIDEDGYLYVTDRLKELIKYKGFQVAPAELEAELLTHAQVVDAAVIGKPDDEAGELPIAYVVAGPDGAPSLEDLQSHLAPRLASYKQIQHLEVVDEIPKSASGKILRRVLRDRLPA